MKTHCTLLLSLCLLILTPAAHFGAEAKKKNERVKSPETPPEAVADVMARFDKNHNGILDAAERAEIRKAFAADASLKALDLNGDGRLDEGELDKAEGGGAPAKPKGKGKKK
ncbi:MAG: hypothetical protein HY301_08105 [Verrucomicrobia bacterium]|nr:hypothetical protein [Verrucomicrobiota bacterium]